MPLKVDEERILRNVIELRVLELAGAPDAVADVREDLERLVGPTVGRAVAARVLGVSQTALDRHVSSCAVGVVETPYGRLEVPLGELVSLAVDRRRHAAARRPLSAALAERRERASRLTAGQLLLPHTDGHRTGHRRAELQSLAYHRAVALRLDRQLVRDARRRLRRWRADGRIDPGWADRWESALEEPPGEIRRLLVRDDPDAADLRQTSPFAGSLSEPERRRVLELLGRSS